MQIKVIERDVEGRGGFSFRNMGPDDKTVLPGEVFPSEWVEPNTLKRYMADGHIVEVKASEDTVDVQADVITTPEEPAEPTEEIEEVVEEPAEEPADTSLEEFCVFPKEDLKKMKLEEINDLYKDICEQVGAEFVPFKGNDGKAEAIELLSSGAAE